MKITIDTEAKRLQVEDGSDASETHDLFGPEAFSILSRWWVKLGWNRKYTYDFTWFGRRVIQLPEDLIRVQELIYAVQPDVLIETGCAHGGSAIFYASLFQALGKGRVVSIDVEIRPHNREALDRHALRDLLTLIERDALDPQNVEEIRAHLEPDSKVMVVLDSCHTKEHVLGELELYGPLVTPGSYVVVMDGLMEDLHDVPRGHPEWKHDNPKAAAQEFLSRHPEFELDESYTSIVTHWPLGYLKRREEQP